MVRSRTSRYCGCCTERPRRIVYPGLTVLAAAALLLSLSAQYAEAQGPDDCPMTMDDFAEDTVDAIPLSPGCAETRLSSTLMMYPGSFLRQHALCPDATVSASPTGVPQPFVLKFASDADAQGADRTKGTSYVVSRNKATKRGISAYTVASQAISSLAPLGGRPCGSQQQRQLLPQQARVPPRQADPCVPPLDVKVFMSFAVNTSEFNTPLMLSGAVKDATMVWNYDTDQKTGLILAINVAIFAPGFGASASNVEAWARKAKINGNCVEAFGPSNFTTTARGVQYVGIEDFGTGRLQLFAQLQKGSCSVDSVVFLNSNPMETGCGIPPPPPPALARQLFLQCALNLGLPFIIDALKDLLKDSADQTVPSKLEMIATSSRTVQKLRQRGAALISAATSGMKDVRGSFQYDGVNAWAIDLDTGIGDVPGPMNLTVFQLLRRILDNCAPFLKVKLNKGAMVNPMTSATFSYSTETQLLDITFTTKQALWQLSAAAVDVGQLVGFNVPNPPEANADSPTTTARVVTDRVNGLRLLSIGLDGSWTVGSLAKRLGLDFGFNDDVIVISNPNVVLVAPPSFQMDDGTVLPSSLRVNLLLSIPGIGLQNAVAGLVIQSRSNYSFVVYGLCHLIPDWPDFGVTGFPFSMTDDSGITATFSTTLYGMTITATLTYRKRVLTALIVASDVSIANVIKGIFSDVNIPSILLDLVNRIQFSRVSISAVYDSTKATKKLTFQFLAVPNIDATPDFGNALSNLGLDPRDLGLSFKPDPSTGSIALAFGVSKTVSVPLPSPFVENGVCMFSVQAISNPMAVQIYGSFSAALNLKGADMPLHFSISAGLLVGPGQPQLLLDAALISPFSLTNYPWIKLNSLSLSAAIEANPAAPILRKLVITGSQLILGATASQIILYNTNVAPPVFAMQVTIEKFDLQSALNQMGIDINLGAFNLLIRSAAFSYAYEDVTVNGIDIPAGLKVVGSITLFDLLDADISLVMQPTGTSFNVAVNTTVLNKVFAKYLVEPIAEKLRAGSAAFQTASNAVDSAASTAKAFLERARADVQAAKENVDAKINVLLKYQEDVTNAFATAQAAVDSALDRFNAAKQRVDSTFQWAQAEVDRADAAFKSARSSAWASFNKAQTVVDDAQKAFDDFRSSKKADFDNAQAKVNDLQEKADCFNNNGCSCTELCGFGRCCCRVCYSCCPGNFWAPPALAIAKGVLSLAWEVFNKILEGAEAATLSTAKEALKVAQTAVDDVLQGVQWEAVKTAKAALEAARVAAQDVLSGTEAAARDTANAALTVAQDEAQNILRSTHYLASAAANATFNAATTTLDSAQRSADAAEAVVRAALDGISSALLKVADPSFFVINGFSVGFAISNTAKEVEASISITIGGIDFRPTLSLDFGNPLGALVDVVKTEGIKVLKSLFQPLADAIA